MLLSFLRRGLLAAAAIAMASTATQAAVISKPIPENFDWTFPGALIKVSAAVSSGNARPPGFQNLVVNGTVESDIEGSNVRVQTFTSGTRDHRDAVLAAYPTHPLREMLARTHMTHVSIGDPATLVSWIWIDGLQANTTYDIFLASYRGSTTPENTLWFLGPIDQGTMTDEQFRAHLRDNVDPIDTINSIGINGDPNDSMRIFTLTSDAAGEIELIYTSDGNTTSQSYFSGLVVIPEPSSLALLGLGGLAMLRRRRAL